MANTLPATLVYNGEVIRDRNEMLSLTDMWKAAGADPSKRPVEWLRSKGARSFIEVLSEMVGKSHLFDIGTGRNARTFAHWQIALAYAKYLSPDFHMWCNEVVRERMEGKSVSVANLPPEVLEMIRRDDGISRMLAHKVTGIESTVQTLAAAVSAMAAIVQPSHPGVYVSGKSSGEIWDEYGLPPLKNGPLWLGNRLAEMGCQMEGCRTVRVGKSRVRAFDPDKATACMKNGLLHKAKVYVAERLGQGSLRLLSGRAA